MDNAHSILLLLSLSLPFSPPFSFSSSVPSSPRFFSSSSFVLQSATRRNSSAIHEPHLARLREISRDPIRYPIFRISPLLLFRPHIASRDRFVVVRHSHLNHSCTRLSESALRVEQLTVDLNTIPTSSPARYFPISSIDSTLFHIFRHTSYYPLATTIIYISVLPRLVRHLRHYVSFFFHFPLFSSTPSSPHVHPACSFLPFVFRSLGLVPVVVPSTEPNDARTAPPNPRGSSSRSLSPAVDLFVSPVVVGSSSTSLGAPLFGGRLQVQDGSSPLPRVFSFLRAPDTPDSFWLS